MNLQQIINSGYIGSIVECGHGAELANSFLSQPGASKFMIRCVQPYSKEVQTEMYGLHDENKLRSVSAKFVNIVASKELNFIKKFSAEQKALTVVTSFQFDTGNTLTHGYMCVATHENGVYNGKIYHLSCYRNEKYDKNTRKTSWISLLKHELLNIIYHHITGNGVKSTFVDGVFDWDNTDSFNLNIIETLKVNQTPSTVLSNPMENFLCFSPQGEFLRFEDVIRLNKDANNKGLIMQKGTYNPLHRMHKKIAEDVCKTYENYPHVLCLSMHTCDKGYNDEQILAQRIDNLIKQGYYVVVSKSGMFLDNVNKIREHYSKTDLKIVFPVGEDTVERFFRDWEDHFNKYIKYIDMRYTSYLYTFNNVEWYITRRESETKNFGELIPKYQEFLPNFVYSKLDMDDISSTAIREGKIANE